MPHTVDAHGGERNNSVSTSVSGDGQNISSDTFSTGETSAKSTVTEWVINTFINMLTLLMIY